MTDRQYEYDVAFSFAQKDETLALSIHKLLATRLKCFIYTEEQKKLAGTDGEMTFNKVFSEESRIVVVFYSADWSHTKWTKIEETAIRNRGFDDGYDFVILIPTEKNLVPPKWLPKNRLWVGLERWGIESAASVIEARVQEFGGEVKELTLAETIAAADSKAKQKTKREHLLKSVEAFKLAETEFEKLISLMESGANEVKQKLGDWHLRIFKNSKDGINLLSYGHTMTFQKYHENIFITFCDQPVDEHLHIAQNFNSMKRLVEDKKKFDINDNEEYGWSDEDTRKNFLTTQKLADKYLKKFFEHIQTYKAQKQL